MTVEERRAFQAREYAEAIRYMDNARETLKKSKKDKYHYADKKYVRTACGTAYNGVLLALEAWLTLKGVEVPRKRGGKAKKSINFYLDNVAKLDMKMLKKLDSTYAILHLYGYYDGETSVKMVEGGFEQAYWIIEKIKPTSP